MTTPLPLYTLMPVALPSAVYSVGVKSRNAMSIVPCWSASFMVDDFE